MMEGDGEVERLRARIAEYENAITWNTSCLGCARLLDQLIVAETKAGLLDGDRSGMYRYRLMNVEMVLGGEVDVPGGGRIIQVIGVDGEGVFSVLVEEEVVGGLGNDPMLTFVPEGEGGGVAWERDGDGDDRTEES